MNSEAQQIQDHIVILGWSERVARMLDRLQLELSQAGRSVPILLVDESFPAHSPMPEKSYLVYGSPSDQDVLMRAGVSRAQMVLIPNTGGDELPVFSLFNILALNPSLKVCVELSSSAHADALRRYQRAGQLPAQVEVICLEELADSLLIGAVLGERGAAPR